MSRNGHIDLRLGGTTRRLRLAIGGLEDLQEDTDHGPFSLLSRAAGLLSPMDEARAVLFHGLIGGGAPVEMADAIVADLSKGEPALVLVRAAGEALEAALSWPEGEDRRTRKETEGAAEEPLPNGRMRFADYYGAGVVMGLGPAEVRGLSLWQFAAAADGFRKANDPEAAKELTDAEVAVMGEPFREGEVTPPGTAVESDDPAAP